MKGQVLDYSVQGNSGVISGADGSRYTFVGSEWKGNVAPSRGIQVNFDVQGGSAVAVYRDLGGYSSGATTGSTAKVATGVGVNQGAGSMKVKLTIIGIVIGGIVGYFAAQHFALWGGFALLGEPYSPARNSLVPGHVFFFSAALGAIGFAIGYHLDKKNKDDA